MESKQLLKLDGSDSDEFKEFELPPARARRPRMRKALAEAKVSGGGRSICSFRCCILFVVSAVLCGVILVMAWMLMNIEKDIEDLKGRIRKVKSDEQSDLLQSKNIQNSVSKRLGSLSKDEKEIAELKSKVKTLSIQVKMLNSTISQMKSQKSSSPVSSNVNEDLNLLKKGMADTGGEIKKLSDESEGAKKTIALLSKLVKSLKTDVLHVKEAVSNLDRSGVRTEPIDTLKPLVPTATPVDKAKENTKSLKKLSNLLKKLVDGYSELFNNKTKKLSLEISDLKTDIVQLNSTTKMNFVSLHNSIAILQNFTRKQEAAIHSVMGQLDNKVMKGAVNETSDGKVLKIVKGILVGLEDNEKAITNLTERVSSIERQVSVEGNQKREESVNMNPVNRKESSPTPEFQTEPSEKPKVVVKTTAAFTTSSAKSLPGTTNQPMKSSLKIKSSKSPTTATTELLTTLDLESTKSEASTTTVPSSSEPGKTSTVGTSPTKAELETKMGSPLSSAGPSTSEGKNSNVQKDVVPFDTPDFNETDRSTTENDTERSTNVTDSVDLTANSLKTTGKRQKTRDGAKQTMKTSDELNSLAVDEPDSEAENMGIQGPDFEGMPSDSDLGYNDDTFEDGVVNSKHGSERHHRTAMDRSNFLSNKRSKHESAGNDDGFEALDHLDDEV